MATVRVRQEGGRVQVIRGRELLFDMPWEAALELAGALRSKGKDAEAFAGRDVIIADASLLRQIGAPGNVIGGFIGKPRVEVGGQNG